jgi:DNA-binding MarR family transcriptional regulator
MKEFPSQFDAAEASPGFMLWQVLNRWQRSQRAALAPLKLTHVQFVLLANLIYREKMKKKSTGAQLAAQAQTDPMMTSQVLRTLLKQGLITRSEAPQDSRAYLLSSTMEGRYLLKKAMPKVEAVDEGFFGPLGASKKAFIRALLLLASS